MASMTNGVRTVVLVGRTGNGKSATGNSILGRRAFKSRTSLSRVTATCELQRTVLKDGQIVNVIDTPGLFDLNAQPEFVGKEIARCIDLAKAGIHAILVVLSIRARFSEEEAAAIQCLQKLFGNKIVKYMILVFTGGDELEDNDETLDDYLGRECPDPLKEILGLCENRVTVFDNKTKNKLKKADQVQQLLSLVDKVIEQNGGQPYTDELFAELKIELKLRETTQKLEEQLAEEQAARQRAEEIAQAAQMKSNDEIRMLREHLERAQREAAALRNKGGGSKCDIM